MNPYLVAIILGFLSVLLESIVEGLPFALALVALLWYLGVRDTKKLSIAGLVSLAIPYVLYLPFYGDTITLSSHIIYGGLSGFVLGIALLPFLLERNFGLHFIGFGALGAALQVLNMVGTSFVTGFSIVETIYLYIVFSLWNIGMLVYVTWLKPTQE